MTMFNIYILIIIRNQNKCKLYTMWAIFVVIIYDVIIDYKQSLRWRKSGPRFRFHRHPRPIEHPLVPVTTSHLTTIANTGGFRNVVLISRATMKCSEGVLSLAEYVGSFTIRNATSMNFMNKFANATFASKLAPDGLNFAAAAAALPNWDTSRGGHQVQERNCAAMRC